jgi:serine/threonine protein kinase
LAYPFPLQPGESLGKYEIVRELATGGMATIYLARVRGTAGFEKSVVLKCILPSLAEDAAFVSMFLDEAKLAATLRHSNIADVFDVGNVGKWYFFAMEHVHGHNARAVRIKAQERARPIPLEVSLAIISGTAAALHYAHTRVGPEGPLEIVHRDVSPTNILVSFDGAVKLVDFGIARASTRGSAKTRTGMRKGKVPYLSPEQCRGKPLDRRSDLFSLGTVAYELTCGQRPFRGSSDFVVMDQIVTCQPEPPSRTIADYPPTLEAIVMKLLALSPQSRYQTAEQVLDEIEDVIAERRIVTSSHVVARYMNELFAEVPTAPFERDTTTDLAQPAHLTREYPHGHPPTGLLQTIGRAPDEEPTEAFRRAEQLWSPELKVKIRSSRRAPTEDSISSAFAEPTRQDVVLPFDPIDARTNEILDQIDAGAPADETEEQQWRRRIPALLERALAWIDSGELDKAVTAVELALDEGTFSAGSHELLQQNVDALVTVYEAMLEDPYRIPTLVRTRQELASVAMEPRARLLLPWIDGQASITQILERSGMQRLEAYHHLCQLLLRGIMQ